MEFNLCKEEIWHTHLMNYGIWYEENENFSENDLSDIEKENIKTISEYIDSF